MTKTEALAFYDGNVSALARALEMDQSTFYSWDVFPPGGRQLQLERLTGGKLKAEPGCMSRRRQGKSSAEAVDRKTERDGKNPGTLTGLGRKTHGRDSETAYMRKTGVR